MRLAETEPFEPVVECLVAWPLGSPEFTTALRQSTQADRDEGVKRLGTLKAEREDELFRARWRRAELERDHPGLGYED